MSCKGWFDDDGARSYPYSMVFALLAPPGGPDLCILTGYCTIAQAGTQPNLLFLATVLVLAGVVLQRNNRRRP